MRARSRAAGDASGRGAGPRGRAPQRRRRASGWSSAPRATRCSPSRPRGRSARGRDEVATEPARLGAGNARTAVWRGAQSSSRSRGGGPPMRGRWSSRSSRSTDPDEAADGRAADRPAAGRRRRASGFVTRCCATRSTRRSPSRAGAGCTSAGRTRCWPPSRRARSRARPRRPAISGSPVPIARRSRSSSAPPPTPGRSRRSSRRSATSRRRLRSRPIAPICGSSSASSRRGGSAAIRRRPRSSGPLALLAEADPLERRARVAAPRARLPRPDLRPARRARQRPQRRSSCSTGADQPAAGRAQRGARRVGVGRGGRRQRRGSRATADRAQRRRRPRDDLLRTYDAGHARALALMRRGRVHRVLRAVDRRRGGDRDAPADPTWHTGAGRTPPAPPCAAGRARTRARVPRSRHGGDRRARPAEPRDPSAGRAIVRAPRARSARRRRAPRRRAEQALAEQLGQPELLAMASHDRGLVALERGDHALAATLLAESLVEGSADQPAADAAGAGRGARARRAARASRRADPRDRARTGPPQRLPRDARAQGSRASRA